MSDEHRLFMVVGIPGSGKSTLVKKLALLDEGSIGISCSALLKTIRENAGCDSWAKFDELSASERKHFIRAVTDELRDCKMLHRTIYADAHMLVQNRITHQLEVALNDADAAIMDGLIFLDTSPQTVFKNITDDNRNGIRQRPLDSLDSLRDHRNLELRAAQTFCERHGLPLIIISNEDNMYSVEEVLDRLARRGQLDAATIDSLSTQIDRHICAIGAEAGPALVLDGDRTLSESDAFRMLDKALGLRDVNRHAFESFGYNLQSLKAVRDNWKRVSVGDYLDTIRSVADDIRLREEWVKLLSGLPTAVPVFLVTSGIPQLWQRILTNHGFDNVRVIGGTHPYLDKELIAPECKCRIVKRLRELGYWVIASGDSPIDAPMLNESDLAIVTPDGKGSAPLIKELDRSGGWFYLSVEGYRDRPNALTFEAITSLVVGMINLDKYPSIRRVSCSEIVSSYLRSKIHGSYREHLVSEHKRIGALFMRYMSKSSVDLSPSKTAVIGVERSGRYLAEGAVDFGNNPLLSAYPVPVSAQTEVHQNGKLLPYGQTFVVPHLDTDSNRIFIFDSVIHSGVTIQNVIDALPIQKRFEIHVFCTEINEAAMEKVRTLGPRVVFHCIRISSRQFRPSHNNDMGARLFRTTS
ncbi:hypothetical protein GCM10011352_05000 [Marinobacterium zhoushanense]|uniref:AAA+ ATPase domain-containing protein n=1 Tax=Marinobacterium zhoushanense TaxID=1679163 RepID=A0ABQ1JYS5_9GAMM|nr:AAA family ATPase [Marinobacterium zhoushanense]GGB82189.1 hypothetical protein GCM10011352_05000 [Marinobacterium zhoushanense]